MTAGEIVFSERWLFGGFVPSFLWTIFVVFRAIILITIPDHLSLGNDNPRVPALKERILYYYELRPSLINTEGADFWYRKSTEFLLVVLSKDSL